MIDDCDRYGGGRSLVASCAFASDVQYWQMKARAKWSNVARTCISDNTSQIRYNITVTAVTDVAQLFIMWIGLLRCRREKRGLLRYLYIQVGGVVFPVPLLAMTMLKLD